MLDSLRRPRRPSGNLASSDASVTSRDDDALSTASRQRVTSRLRPDALEKLDGRDAAGDSGGRRRELVAEDVAPDGAAAGCWCIAAPAAAGAGEALTYAGAVTLPPRRRRRADEAALVCGATLLLALLSGRVAGGRGDTEGT